jgi:hypothetical protein
LSRRRVLKLAGFDLRAGMPTSDIIASPVAGRDVSMRFAIASGA